MVIVVIIVQMICIVNHLLYDERVPKKGQTFSPRSAHLGTKLFIRL